MKTVEKQHKILTQTVQLADRLVADMRERQLKPGETYLTAHEASRFLGVAGAAANRALQLLEKRKIIRRSQRRGSIILEPPMGENVLIDRVHFLVHDKYYRTEGIGGDGILLGIQSELPTSMVTHCFLSPGNEIRQISQLLDRALLEETTDAFVLVRSSYDVQRMIAKSGLPGVVFGNVYEGIDELSQFDRDHGTAIRLIGDFFYKRNRRRLAVLLRQQVLPGDHPMLDALLRMPFQVSALRFTPSEDENIEAVAHSLLASRLAPTPTAWEEDNIPDAFLCHTLRHAECVARVRSRLGIPESALDIVVLSSYLKKGERIPFPHIAIDWEPEKVGRRLGSLLLKNASGSLTKETIPVKLIHSFQEF